MRRLLTPEEKELIIRDFPNTPTEKLAKALGCRTWTISSFAYRNGLKKSVEYLSSPLCGRKYKGCKGSATTFKKGHIPANKGKPMDECLRVKVAHTFFKKGDMPHNTKYDGHISARKDKTGRVYFHIRVELGKYVLLHRHIWEYAYGEIPTKHVVTFKDGDTTNCQLENLELISMKENRLRNSFHERIPPELKPIKYMIAGVKRRINKQRKNHEE